MCRTSPFCCCCFLNLLLVHCAKNCDVKEPFPVLLHITHNFIDSFLPVTHWLKTSGLFSAFLHGRNFRHLIIAVPFLPHPFGDQWGPELLTGFTAQATRGQGKDRSGHHTLPCSSFERCFWPWQRQNTQLHRPLLWPEKANLKLLCPSWLVYLHMKEC